jgi:hypothetical protein
VAEGIEVAKLLEQDGFDAIEISEGLEQENTRLKRLVADISLDNAILKEAARGNF